MFLFSEFLNEETDIDQEKKEELYPKEMCVKEIHKTLKKIGGVKNISIYSSSYHINPDDGRKTIEIDLTLNDDGDF